MQVAGVTCGKSGGHVAKRQLTFRRPQNANLFKRRPRALYKFRKAQGQLHRIRSSLSNRGQCGHQSSDFRPRAMGEVDERMLEYLADFTGLNATYIESCICRRPGYTHADEFGIRRPQDESELQWFYVTSEKNIFVNQIHRPWSMISEMVSEGKVLDYGAGVGTDVLALARKGYETHYFDISLIQREFVEYVCEREGLSVVFIRPYFEGKFDPVHCIQGRFDAIIVRSVLEHVPYYAELIEHLVSCLNHNGLFFEASRFGKSEKDPMHLEERRQVPAIMEACGMRLVRDEFPHRCWGKS